ncbi:MAG: hypothetical protein H5U03_03285, partial [Clostridia bacterium]|nr:hypothetical protein [Clostridia bacterium]
HWGAFDNPVAIGQDYSKFDQHISKDALQYEHGKRILEPQGFFSQRVPESREVA